MNERYSPRRRRAARAVVLLIGAVGLGWLFQQAAARIQSDGSTPDAASIDREDRSQGACRAKADWLVRQLGDGAEAFVEPPLAVVGPARTETLAKLCQEVLQPTARALANDFGIEPSDVEPIGVLVFFNEQEYRDAASRLCGETDVSRFGFHVPHLRLIVANYTTGPQVLRHELAHALIDRHGRSIPPWLDEGLAALYETPLDGGRPGGFHGDAEELTALRSALANNRLPRLESLTSASWTLDHHDGLSRIYLRWFCAFLRKEGRLGAVWQHAMVVPQAAAGSPASLLDAASIGPTAAIESQFHQWLAGQSTNRLPKFPRGEDARTP